VCTSNGCVGGPNGEDVWPLGAKAMGIDGASVDTADNYCASNLQTQPSSYSSHSSDGQNKTRRTRPMSVLHVIRDKLKPSKSRSLQFSECALPTVQCDTEATRNCCSLTNNVCESQYDAVKGCCNPANSTDQCSCDTTGIALPAAEKADSSDTTENCGEVLSANSASCTDQLTSSVSVPTSTPTSDSVTDLRCSAVKSHTVHGGLVLSQLSNIVSVEACLKSDQIVEETSRLPLSPMSNSDSGLDTPDERQPARWTLANELLRLSRYGWYWGPVSREEAEEKLAGQPEGAFLVRDSTDDRYLFSLSFRSSGRTLHTRVEYCNGEFSFYAQPQSDSYRSMAELIEQCVTESQSGIYCYSRGTSGVGSQSYPVKLTRPVSRFAQVRTLQYLCRFVIRQHTRVDHIQNLPLPVSVKGWLKENQY